MKPQPRRQTQAPPEPRFQGNAPDGPSPAAIAAAELLREWRRRRAGPAPREHRGRGRKAGSHRDAAPARGPEIAAGRAEAAKYRGVRYVAATGRFRAWLAADGGQLALGNHDTALQAAWAHDATARLIHGKSARLNFPDDGEGVAP